MTGSGRRYRLRWLGPAGMGPTGPSATLALTSSWLSSWSPSSSSCHLPPVPARPAEVGCFWTLGDGHKAVKGKIPSGGEKHDPEPHILGTRARRSVLLLGVRRLPVLFALHELLIERHALLAERTGVGRIRWK